MRTTLTFAFSCTPSLLPEIAGFDFIPNIAYLASLKRRLLSLYFFVVVHGMQLSSLVGLQWLLTCAE